MTSEHNPSYGNYSNFQKSARNTSQGSSRFPNRKPTEGEIDQFIELLKNSNTTDQGSQRNPKENRSQCGDSNLKSESSASWKNPGSYENTPTCDPTNSSVTFKIDGTLMKTIHVQSPESYLKEAERFEEELRSERVLKHDVSYNTRGGYTLSSPDYLRKTTYMNKNSELKVTISRDEDKSYGYMQSLDERGMKSRDDTDSRKLMDVDKMYSSNKSTNSDPYSRNFGYPQSQERYPNNYGSGSSSNYSRCPPNSSYSRDTDLRIPPSRSPSMSSQRPTYSGDIRYPRERSRSPLYSSYPESAGMKLGENSPYRSCGSYHHEREKRPALRSPWSRSRSRSLSPVYGRSRRADRTTSKDMYNPREENSFSDYDMRRNSTAERSSERQQFGWGRSSPCGVPSPPSPPPPPVLSDMKSMTSKKMKKTKLEEPPLQKPPVNPISTLLADRNVSISTLLEAAIGTSVYLLLLIYV